ncbi:PAS domain-containing sensor histidine kinase, partial [Streptomyces sp. WAC07149]
MTVGTNSAPGAAGAAEERFRYAAGQPTAGLPGESAAGPGAAGPAVPPAAAAPDA